MKHIFTVLLFALIATVSLAGERHKIIFDCDLGDDIDDAFALAMILASDEFEVLGICLDWGNTEDRAVLASRMLYEVGATDIPVYVGRKTSNHDTTQHSWGVGFDKVKTQKMGAAEFIVETLNKYPGEVSLITVGPVTNMKDVIGLDKNALSNTKHIYAMFGSFYVGYGMSPVISAEWNVKADEEASRMYVNNVTNITYVGLDVTTFMQWDGERSKKMVLRRSPLTDSLAALTVVWKHGQHNTIPTLYDCVAVGMILWPDLFSVRPAHVKVIDGGYTVIDESKAPNGFIAMEVKKEEFLDRLLDLYINQNMKRNNVE